MPYADLEGDKMILPMAPIEYQGGKRARSKSVCHVNTFISGLLPQERERGARRRSECFIDQRKINLSPTTEELAKTSLAKLDDEPLE